MINKMINYVQTQMNRRKDIEEGLYKLKWSLLKFQNVVASTEMMQLTPLQKEILSELKKAVYEADDFLDELDYDYLEKEAEKADLSSSIMRKTKSARKFGKRLIGKDEMHNNLGEILKKFDRVNDLAKEIPKKEGQDVNHVVDIPNNRLTSAYNKEKEIFGRDDQKEELVRILTESSDEPKNGGKKDIAVVALVGQGGIGKTTLAQHVYNDERIKDRFKLRIWVCVSTSSDKSSIIKQILDGASENPETHITNFNKLMDNLREKLKSKFFLLVLDDIWYNEKLTELENANHWRELLAPLRDADGSRKIVVTTREIRTAKALEATGCIELKGLSDDDCWSLLRSCAFRDVNPTDHPELEAVGEEIAKSLKGSPLAAQVIGDMLRSKLDFSYWKDISQRKVFDDIMKILKLSYDSLPEHLKPCFFTCAIFHKDFKFDPDNLVPLWIAQGYVQTRSDEPMEMIATGKTYFDDLVSRSFFQPTEDNEDGNSPSYVMHDLIHDLAQTVSGGEYLLIEGTIQKQTPYHLGVLSNTEDDNLVMKQLKKSCKLQDLRTLIYFSYGYPKIETSTLTDVFKELKGVRAVVIYGRDFSSTELEVLMKSLANKKHLRYLNLVGEWLSIPPLYHLQTIMTVYGGSRTLNEGLAHLKRFGNLIVCKGYFFVFEVERESQQRDSFICKLKEFVDVLHGNLYIRNLQNLYNKEEALEVGIENGRHISELTLQWNLPGDSTSNSIIFEDVIDGLQPHPNLRRLFISNYGGIRLPSWLEKNGSFPRLENLVFVNFPNLSELNGENWDKLFPCLKRFTIKGCPNLMELHLQKLLLLRKLFDLEVRDAGRSLEIYDCQKVLQLRNIDGPLQKDNMAGLDLSVVSFLQELRFEHCKSLPNLRFRKGGAENSDQKNNCIDLPSSFEVLEFSSCSSEDAWLWRCLEGLPCLKRLHIHRFKFLTPDNGGLGERDYYNHVPCAQLDLLEIYASNLTDRLLSQCLLNVANVSELVLKRCYNLTSLPPAEVLHRLTALRELRIDCCDQLISLGGLNALVNLQEMAIFDCPKLELLPDLPASVKSLKIKGCHP